MKPLLWETAACVVCVAAVAAGPARADERAATVGAETGVSDRITSWLRGIDSDFSSRIVRRLADGSVAPPRSASEADAPPAAKPRPKPAQQVQTRESGDQQGSSTGPLKTIEDKVGEWMGGVQDWLARASSAYQSRIVRPLSKGPEGGSADTAGRRDGEPAGLTSRSEERLKRDLLERKKLDADIAAAQRKDDEERAAEARQKELEDKVRRDLAQRKKADEPTGRGEPSSLAGLPDATAEKRLAEERAAAERKRLAEEQATKEAEEKRLAEERAAAERRANQDAAAAKEAERKRLAEESRLAEEQTAKEAERKRLAEEQAAAERQRLAEERAERAAEQKRLADERATQAAEEKRLAEERAAAERKARQDAAAAKEAERKRLAQERAAKAAEEKRLADEQAEAKRRAEIGAMADAASRLGDEVLARENKAAAAAKRKSSSEDEVEEGSTDREPRAAPSMGTSRRHASKATRAARHARRTAGCRNAGRRVKPPATYVVARGDTLWDIAERHYHKAWRYPVIYRANRSKIDDPDLIFPCQRLFLPARRR